MAADAVGMVVDWPQLNDLCAQIRREVAADSLPDVIVGVLRGGMVPAVLLAHSLHVRAVRGIHLSRTLDESVNASKTPGAVAINSESLGDLSAADVLIVDDVAASGETLAAARTLVTKAGALRVRSAVCVINDLSWQRADEIPRLAPTYVGAHSQGWVIFPWEIQ